MKTDQNTEKIIASWSKEYKKGITSYLILTMLENRSMYGYEIKIELEKLFKTWKFQESGIYQILKKFKKENLVTMEIKRSEKGPKRKYYSISETGGHLTKKYTEEFIKPVHEVIDTMVRNRDL